MRYELRTTLPIDTNLLRVPIDTTDKLLRWLYEFLPVRVTEYRNVFAATADRLRIDAAVPALPPVVRAPLGAPEFEVLRVLGDAELVDWSDPTKIRITYP
jgi:hypothetical protein